MKQEILRVAALQMRQEPRDIETNIAKLESILEAQFRPDTDVVVLPEMWTTGFMVDVQELEDDYLHRAYDLGVNAMRQLAKRYQCAFYGSLIQLQPSGKPANAGVFVTPDGTEVIYLKKHLFGPGGEAKLFEAGDLRKQIEYKGWVLRLSTCYDMRFPVWLRQDQSLGYYDVLLCSSNWPKPRHIAWERLLRARSIENQCFTIAANRVSYEGEKPEYPGYSFVLDAFGDSIAESKEPEELMLYADLSDERLEKFRANFPVLQDGDKYEIL